MPFTNKEFPNKVFEDTNELKLCVEVRDKIKKEIKEGIKKTASLVEVAAVIKKDNPLLIALIELLKRMVKKNG